MPATKKKTTTAKKKATPAKKKGKAIGSIKGGLKAYNKALEAIPSVKAAKERRDKREKDLSDAQKKLNDARTAGRKKLKKYC